MTNEEVYALAKEIFDGMTGLANRMARIEAELIHRRQIEELRRRFAAKHFDTCRAVKALEPLRDPGRTIDRRYVTKTFSDFRKGKPKVTKGETLGRLIHAMGLEVLDVDGKLHDAEVVG